MLIAQQTLGRSQAAFLDQTCCGVGAPRCVKSSKTPPERYAARVERCMQTLRLGDVKHEGAMAADIARTGQTLGQGRHNPGI